MTTTVSSSETASNITRPVRLLGVFLVLGAIAYFCQLTFARYTHFDAEHYRGHWATRWWLVAHLGGGSLALLLGPFQFVPILRRRYAIVHRWTGRLYLSGVLIGSISAVYMCFYVERSRAFALSLFFLAFAWTITSAMGLIAALSRQFTVHREWMIRSYVVTFGFVVFRLAGQLHFFRGLTPETDVTTRGWFCWAIPLLLAEVVLQWNRTIGSSRRV